MKITVLSLIFELNNWSWGLIADALHKEIENEFEITAMEAPEWAKKHACRTDKNLILAQNVSIFRWITQHEKTIVRCGGNMSFDIPKVVNEYLTNMKKCPAVIVTNQKLFKIVSAAHKRVYLVPNGLDLDGWSPLKTREWCIDRPVVGFIGNVLNSVKSQYKGYDFVKTACKNIGLPMVEALYKTKQIPHDRMKQDFWDKIDILILPTAGEGCSNTIMEALACGVPVITTRRAGFHGELLEHGKDVLFCDRSSQSIEDCLGQIIGKPEMFQSLSANGRAFAEKNHDIRIIADQYRSIFKECYALLG